MGEFYPGKIFPAMLSFCLMRLLILILVFTLCCALPVFAMGGALRSGQFPEIGKPAPNFILKDLLGNDIHLSDYKNKVVLLTFWATWCPPCREEMPVLQRLHNKMAGRDFIILAVSVDHAGPAKVNDFLIKGGYTFKVLLDAQNRAASKYAVAAIPTAFLIDKKGKIVEQHIGMLNWTSLAAMKRIEELMKK
jgi:peroxiredoxin